MLRGFIPFLGASGQGRSASVGDFFWHRPILYPTGNTCLPRRCSIVRGEAMGVRSKADNHCAPQHAGCCRLAAEQGAVNDSITRCRARSQIHEFPIPTHASCSGIGRSAGVRRLPRSDSAAPRPVSYSCARPRQGTQLIGHRHRCRRVDVRELGVREMQPSVNTWPSASILRSSADKPTAQTQLAMDILHRQARCRRITRAIAGADDRISA